MSAKYDIIGINYAELRKPDQRIAHVIAEALGSARAVLNVGAGAGSYEPTDRTITAVEPSVEMIKKRNPSAAQAIQAFAESLPFEDNAFDASMAILTVHHWTDKEAGLREMRRVTRGRMILLTFDPGHRPWLTDYIPELAILDAAQMPTMSDFERWLGPVTIAPVPIPHNCSDGFLYSYWRRPAAYLDPKIRSGSSSFWAIKNVEPSLDILRRDLETGEWERKYSDILELDSYDAGYRLIVVD